MYLPIYFGGGSPAFDRVARFGDAWLANGLPPDKLEPMLDDLKGKTGRDVPVTVFNASKEPEDLEAYARLGVEHILLSLPTLSERETSDHLDQLSRAVAALR